MEVDALLEEVIGGNDSSISSIEVSEDEGQAPEENTKKRKRDEIDDEEDEIDDTILYVAELSPIAFLWPEKPFHQDKALNSTKKKATRRERKPTDPEVGTGILDQFKTSVPLDLVLGLPPFPSNTLPCRLSF